MVSFIAVVGDASHPNPVAGAIRSAHYGAYRSFDKLRTANHEAWIDHWKGRVVVEGATELQQQGLDAGLFYLLSSAHTSSRNGLSIDAYSCLEYGGLDSSTEHDQIQMTLNFL